MRIRTLLLLTLFIFPSLALGRELSIGTMIVGGSALELSNIRQLSTHADGEVAGAWVSPNGRYVAYISATGPENMMVCVVDSTGGRPDVIMERQTRETPNEAQKTDVEIWKLLEGAGMTLSWSPDSKILAVPVTHQLIQSGKLQSEHGIGIFNASGRNLGYFPLGKVREIRDIRWSPDGSRFAMAVLYDDPQNHRAFGIGVFDTGRMDFRLLPLAKGIRRAQVDFWARDGKSIAYSTATKEGPELRQIREDGTGDELLMSNCGDGDRSPDGRFLAVNSDGQIEIQNFPSGQLLKNGQISSGEFKSWAPKGRMFLYTTSSKVADETGKRAIVLATLWLRSLEEGRLNHVYITSMEPERGIFPPTCSDDCSKIAYISGSAVYLAELKYRQPTAYEKAAAGLKLSEEERVGIVRDNAKQVGLGMLMYSQDWDGSLPPDSTSVNDDLFPYLKDMDLFYMPGTEKNIFEYHPQKLSDVENPSDTVMGEMNAGDGWRVLIFCDGHVRTVRG